MFEQLMADIRSLARPLLERSWLQIRDQTPIANMQYATSVVGTSIYLFGGRNGVSTNALNTARKITNGVIQSLAVLPVNLVCHAAAAIGNKIYIFGGCTAMTNGRENRNIYVYDILTNTYDIETNSMPFTSLNGAACAIGEDLYIYGGAANQNESGFVQCFWKYNSVNKTWTQLKWHDGTPYNCTACVVIDDKIYTFGGEWNNASQATNVIRVYDPIADTWTSLAVSGIKPSARGGAAMARFNNEKFLVLGGRINYTTISPETWEFDIPSLSWTKLANYPGNIAFNKMECVNERVFNFPGYRYPDLITGNYELR